MGLRLHFHHKYPELLVPGRENKEVSSYSGLSVFSTVLRPTKIRYISLLTYEKTISVFTQLVCMRLLPPLQQGAMLKKTRKTKITLYNAMDKGHSNNSML